MSGISPGSSIKGGYSSSPAAQQEQCTVMLHYWPRVESMRGCSAALDSDKLLGENMCSAEAQDLISLMGAEAAQFPMRCVLTVRLPHTSVQQTVMTPKTCRKGWHVCKQ